MFIVTRLFKYKYNTIYWYSFVLLSNCTYIVISDRMRRATQAINSCFLSPLIDGFRASWVINEYIHFFISYPRAGDADLYNSTHKFTLTYLPFLFSDKNFKAPWNNKHIDFKTYIFFTLFSKYYSAKFCIIIRTAVLNLYFS